MSERYDQDASLPYDDGLDEYLCEYVDGTMDPAVRRAFEEFLKANPALEEHVRRLQRTRQLCTRQQCAHAPRGLQHRLRVEIARDLMGDDAATIFLPRLGTFAVLTSLVGLAVLLGVVAGASLVDRRVATGPDSLADRVEQPAVPSDAHAYPSTRVRPRAATAGFGVSAPVQTLPVLTPSGAVTPIGDCDSLSYSVALRRAQVTP